MEHIPAAEAERTMKVQEVKLRAIAKKISWWQAAEILGISERSLNGVRCFSVSPITPHADYLRWFDPYDPST
jgi:hypothetical protein